MHYVARIPAKLASVIIRRSRSGSTRLGMIVLRETDLPKGDFAPAATAGPAPPLRGGERFSG